MKQLLAISVVLGSSLLIAPPILLATAQEAPQRTDRSKVAGFVSLIEQFEERRSAGKTAYIEYSEYRFMISSETYGNLVETFQLTNKTGDEEQLDEEIDSLLNSAGTKYLQAWFGSIATDGEICFEQSFRITEIDTARDYLSKVAEERGAIAGPLSESVRIWSNDEVEYYFGDQLLVIQHPQLREAWQYKFDGTLHPWSRELDPDWYNHEMDVAVRSESDYLALSLAQSIEDFGQLTSLYMVDPSHDHAIMSVESRVNDQLMKAHHYAYAQPNPNVVDRPIAVLEAKPHPSGNFSVTLRRIHVWDQQVRPEALELVIEEGTPTLDRFHHPLKPGCMPEQINDPPIPYRIIR